MATNWYDPTGKSSGFYNAPQDSVLGGRPLPGFMAQGPSGQADASRMPTMAETMGSPIRAGATEYYDWSSPAPTAPQSSPSMLSGNPNASWSEGLPWASSGPSRVAPGGSINLGDNVEVPGGALWNRYQAVQANPAMIEADPAYRYMLEQGEEALRRSAGARRKRFAGQTMLDFQRHAQGQAAGFMKQLLPELRAGAGEEYQRDRQNILGRRTEATMQALQADPYGTSRKLAAKYKTLNDFLSSPTYAAWARAGQGDKAQQMWMEGNRLNQSIWGG